MKPYILQSGIYHNYIYKVISSIMYYKIEGRKVEDKDKKQKKFPSTRNQKAYHVLTQHVAVRELMG